MWPHLWYGGGGWWVVMLLSMLLFWTAIGIGLYLLYRVVARQGAFTPPAISGDTPRAVIDRRLAAGEITLDEYRALRETLDQP
ncbi:MAG: hypothetical protein BWY76_01315 [bacterium ADurb.Bin429]|nr:MAG: hypothetical protein BWY76_01315 [bacterium ADurb.Bin429]